MAVAILWMADAGTAFAQIRPGMPTPRLGSVEVGGGLAWTQGFDFGSEEATLTRNPGTGSGPFVLFTSSTELVPSAGGQAHLAFYVSRSLSLEAGLNYSRPLLRTRLSNDAEEAPPITASETLTRYLFEGSAVFHLRRLSFARDRGVPFVFAGGGYVRELHQGNELVETGQELHAGGGVKLWFGTGRRRIGVRSQAAISVQDGGFDFREGRRALPTASVSLMYLF